MNEAAQLQADLERWPQGSDLLWKPPQLQPCRLNRGTSVLLTAPELLACMQDFMRATSLVGWIETADKVDVFRSGDACPVDSPVLNAELVAGGALAEGHSLHVRLIDGAWQVTHLKDGGAGEPLLKDQVRLACSDPEVGCWIYDRYWEAQPSGRLQMVAARLAGTADDRTGGGAP
jgi:hypothetical protein